VRIRIQNQWRTAPETGKGVLVLVCLPLLGAVFLTFTFWYIPVEILLTVLLGGLVAAIILAFEKKPP